ncbi:4Fe-4S dicluster domain-containing protein [Clostridium sp. YIM B02505]|uniref:4Fe-4S dicluster domain-containing protein n=1 Tax=Clostridium yunnanense TaxID=2800325 RepID=A0ABS1EVH3_9CLOT|nr:4Fe-4S dicluster domain-containing protein [Clostridium yunnanense]MBK1813379.1 4Fe-4S dicluster domain-containing protein [Clostridium yunnanense]
MNRIIIDKALCEGCMNCTLACMAEHSESATSIFDVNLHDIKNESRSYIALDAEGKPTPIFCRHCDVPECANACMSGAMTKDSITGIVSYNEKKCASCYMCVISCPYGVLKSDDASKKVILKCDLCNGREVPRCVENCPTGAIHLYEEV